ncbi:MAG TPA: hypothetical protein ENH07_08255, partial [Nitrospirae bacterium]|nr:hypothetical protein [Nitrospirota bacterium]
MKQLYRADLHVHSSFSNKPSVWAIRKVNCPESYTTPEFIYKTAAEKGMSWVTITDHNTINGALEIAHLPGTFISVEATSYFPEDGCKIHVVALDITEDSFKDVMGLRKNVYELAAYLREAGIIHFVAHPLYDMNGKLTVETIEKMLLLFEVFEIKNGARADRFNKLIQDIVSSLTRERIEAISDKQGIVPSGARPWKKALVGGSDDHSGFFIARAHTVSAEGKTIKEFISSIRENKTWAEGNDGDPLTLAHSIYGIGYRFYTERVKPSGNNSMPFVSFLLNKCLKTEPARLSLIDKVKFFIRKNIRTGTNGFIFANHDRADFKDRITRIAEELAATGIYTFWISIDSAVAEVHESMRGLPGVIAGIEKALPVFHEHGIYPSANLGINRNTGGRHNLAGKDSVGFHEYFKESFRRFFAFVINMGFTITN